VNFFSHENTLYRTDPDFEAKNILCIWAARSCRSIGGGRPGAEHGSTIFCKVIQIFMNLCCRLQGDLKKKFKDSKNNVAIQYTGKPAVHVIHD
jgi:hypothetical protein